MTLLAPDNKLLFKRPDWDFDLIRRVHDACGEIAINEMGLDPYPNHIEVITTEQMLDAYASTGMPLFYRHWSFGKEFARNEALYRKGYQGPKRDVVENNRIGFEEKIQFDFDKATIKPESDGLLQEIIKVIKENAHIKKIAVEGHTSSEGSDRHNLKLSDQRAKAVMDYMINKGGLAKEMFTAKGFGETKLIADESTEEGKEKNRRVEFNITAQTVTEKKVEIDPKSGEKTILEKKGSEEDKTTPPAGDAGAAPAPAPAPAK